MSEPVRRNGHAQTVSPGNNGQVTGDIPGSNLAALIQDAEAVHATLSDARSSVARLIPGLRRHRKQSRLLTETLKSLRQLKLTESVE